MKTKWDCLSALFDLKEANLSAIAKISGTSLSCARQHLVKLLGDGLAVQEGKAYKPDKNNARAWKIFNIMKFCKSKGINHNPFLTLEFAKIVRIGLSNNQVPLSEFLGVNHQTARKYLNYLSRANLIFVTSRRPFVVRFVEEPIFEEVLEMFGMKKEKKKIQKRHYDSKDFGEIEKLLAGFGKTWKDLNISEVEWNRKIEFASSSIRLAGNNFTLEEAKELILHDSVPKNKKLKEANEVKNCYLAVDYLLSHLNEPLSVPFILDLHRISTFNLGIPGGIRNVNVSVKGNPFYRPVHFSEINAKLERLCEDANEFLSAKRTVQEAIEFATFIHNEVVHIRPFEDGNSRIARLLWNYVLMRSGFPLMNIYSNAKEEYLSLTELARERDDAKLNEFLTKVIKDNLYKIGKLED